MLKPNSSFYLHYALWAACTVSLEVQAVLGDLEVRAWCLNALQLDSLVYHVNLYPGSFSVSTAGINTLVLVDAKVFTAGKRLKAHDGAICNAEQSLHMGGQGIGCHAD